MSALPPSSTSAPPPWASAAWLRGKKMVADEGESVHPRWDANAITSDGCEKKRSCWADAIGSDVYELTNESAISFLGAKWRAGAEVSQVDGGPAAPRLIGERGREDAPNAPYEALGKDT